MAVKKRDSAGRPEAVIDWKQVEGYIKARCTATEIAATLGIDVSTLRRRCETDNNLNFATYYQQKRQVGRVTVKSVLYNSVLAAEYDPKYIPALIFYAKSELGMSDKPKEDKEQNLSINVVTVPKPENEAS